MAYTLENARILIVDDMNPMLKLTQSVLGVFGFKDIIIAENGKEGFEKACAKEPDLIITDWMMPGMDGLEFTKKIRTHPTSPNPYVPIIMMTGFSSRLRVENARDIGITEFLVKPFTSHDLYARVRKIIEQPRQFVDAESFFGPDRRRRKDEDYEGPRRRDVDSGPLTTSADQQKRTSDILKKLRQETKTAT